MKSFELRGEGENGTYSLSLQSPSLSVSAPESTVLEAVLKHSTLITEAIQQKIVLQHFSDEEEHVAKTVKEVRGNKSNQMGRIWQGDA
jgi:hypothetical protein